VSANGRLTLSRDIQVLKTYGAAPYAAALKRLEKQIKEKQTSVNEKIGESRSVYLHPHHFFWATLILSM
jgi:hypothetical protein